MVVRHRLVGGVVAILGLATPGCSYLNPYGSMQPRSDEVSVTALYPKLESIASQSAASTRAALESRQGFIGGLPEQIQRTELRRGQLIEAMNRQQRERMVYDAAVYTVAPWLVYRLVSPGYSDLNTQHQLAGGAAGLAAWRLSLGERTDGVPTLYDQSILGLGCAITRSGRYLFTQAELDGQLLQGLRTNEAGFRTVVERWRDLPQALDVLHDEEWRVENAVRVLPTGESRAACAIAGSADCRVRAALLDRGGVDREAQARGLGQQMAAIDGYARSVYTQIETLLGQIDYRAALDLSQETAMEMERLRVQLRAKDPGLENLSALFTSLNAETQALAASAASAAASAASAAASAASAAEAVATAAKSGAATPQGQSRDRQARAAHKVNSAKEMTFDLEGIVLFDDTAPSKGKLLGPAPRSAQEAQRLVAEIGSADLGDRPPLLVALNRLRDDVGGLQALLADAQKKAEASESELSRFGCSKLGGSVASAP